MMLPTAVYSVEVPEEGVVHFDPLAIRRSLLTATSGRCWEWAKQAHDLSKSLSDLAAKPLANQEEHTAKVAEWSAQLADFEGRLVPAAYEAFGLAPIDPKTGAGVTEGVALALLQDYLAWMEEKKSAGGSGPTGSLTPDAVPLGT